MYQTRHMNNKHLLASCITLLFLKSKLPHKSTSTSSLVLQVLELIKLPELTGGGLDQERDAISCLIKTIKQLVNESEIDKLTLLQQITIDCGNDSQLLESMKVMIEAELTEEEIAGSAVSLEKKLNKYLRDTNAIELFYEKAKKLKFSRDDVDDIPKYLMQSVSEIEPFLNKGDSEDPAVIADFDLSDSKAVETVFDQAKKAEEGIGSFVFGFKHINKFFRGALGAGKTLLVGALQHQHKTGFTLALFRHAAIYNTPFLREEDEGKKPLLLRISAEDEITDNLTKIFTDTYFNAEKKVPVISDMTSEYMRAYIHEKWSANGWHVRFMRINPSAWTYRDIERKIIELESLGYCVKLCMLDYLMMIPTTGCEKGATGEDKRDLVRRVRNFMSARGITFITPWQLSPDATKMVREGRDNLVKEFVNKSMYSGSTQINQEVDAEILIHIESINGVKYLTCARGKYRQGGAVVADKDLFCALPFHPEAGLQDDLHGPTLGVSTPGAIVNENGEEEKPMWEF